MKTHPCIASPSLALPRSSSLLATCFRRIFPHQFLGRLLFLTYLFLMILLKEVQSHGLEIQQCRSTEGAVCFFIRHWHGVIPDASGAGTLKVRNNINGAVSDIEGEGVLNSQQPLNSSLTGCEGGVNTTLVNDCNNHRPTNDDWVYFDFEVNCSAPVNYTLLQGNTLVLEDGCKQDLGVDLYGVNIEGSDVCKETEVPSSSPSSMPSRLPTPAPTPSPTPAPTPSPTPAPNSQPPTPQPTPAPASQPSSTPQPTPAPASQPSPSPQPTPAPASQPSPQPTPAPVPPPPPTEGCKVTDPSRCVDAKTRFVLKNKRGLVKDCAWVTANATKIETRCNRKGVASHCPLSCGACDMYSHADSEMKFNLMKEKNKPPLEKSCAWVKKKYFKLEKRCKRRGVRSTCREACDCFRD